MCDYGKKKFKGVGVRWWKEVIRDWDIKNISLAKRNPAKLVQHYHIIMYFSILKLEVDPFESLEHFM